MVDYRITSSVVVKCSLLSSPDDQVINTKITLSVSPLFMSARPFMANIDIFCARFSSVLVSLVNGFAESGELCAYS